MGLLTAPTPVFAKRARTTTGWSSGSNADVFSRQDRTPATYLDPSSQSADVRFEIGDRSITITHSCGALHEKWIPQVLMSLAARWGSGFGWDGYDAHPTNPDLAAVLLNCLETAMPENASPPLITPLSDGGVQAEWHKGETTLEIIAPADGATRFYFYDGLTGNERSGFFSEEAFTISELIEKF